MVTLAKYEKPKGKLYKERTAYWRQIAEQAFTSEGVMHAGWQGFLTIEDTTGWTNYNPANKMVKVVYYTHDPHTRRGYHAKFKIKGKQLIAL